MAGKYTAKVGVRYSCVGNILLGGGASGSIVQLGIVVNFGGNDEDGGDNPYNLPK